MTLPGTIMLIGSVVYDYMLGHNDSAGTKKLGDWDDFVFDVNTVSEPEKSVMLLVCVGLIGFSLRKQKVR